MAMDCVHCSGTVAWSLRAGSYLDLIRFGRKLIQKPSIRPNYDTPRRDERREKRGKQEFTRSVMYWRPCRIEYP